MPAARDRSAPCVYVTVMPPGQKVTRLLMQYDSKRGLWNDPSAPELRLLSWDIEDRDRGADKLKLTVDNRDLANFDSPLWPPTASSRSPGATRETWRPSASS